MYYTPILLALRKPYDCAAKTVRLRRCQQYPWEIWIYEYQQSTKTWWCYEMESFPHYWLVITGLNHRWISLTTVMQNFDVFFEVNLNKLLNKQQSLRSFETPWRSYDVIVINWKYKHTTKHNKSLYMFYCTAGRKVRHLGKSYWINPWNHNRNSAPPPPRSYWCTRLAAEQWVYIKVNLAKKKRPHSHRVWIFRCICTKFTFIYGFIYISAMKTCISPFSEPYS